MPGVFQADVFQNDVFQVDEYPFTGGSSSFSVANGVTVLINGLSYAYKTGTLRISEQIQGRNQLTVTILSLDATFRPQVFQEFIMFLGDVRIFGGNIEEVQEGLMGGETAGIALEYNLTVMDFNSYADWVYMNYPFPPQTLKATMLQVVVNLAGYGVTIDPAQVDGPVLPAYNAVFTTVAEAMGDLTDIATPLMGVPQAVPWEIDYYKVFRAYGVLDSGHAAPFNVTASTAVLSDTVVRPYKTDYASVVSLLYGTGQKEITDDVGVGDGSTLAWLLHYTPNVMHGYVNVGGVIESLGTAGSGATWTYNVGDNTVTRIAPAPAVGALILVPYEATFPAFINAIASSPPMGVQKIYTREDIFDHHLALATANGILAQVSQIFKEITYTVGSIGAGCHPGQVQTVVLPKHGLNGSVLITAVEIDDSVETEFRYTITGITSTAAVPASWMNMYELWSRGTAGSSGGSVATVVAQTSRQSYFLGGSSTLYVQSPTPDWIPADAVRITIDSALRGSLAATAYIRLRATSGGVTARIRNITDGVTAGTSFAVFTTDWTDLSFPVALASGVKTYELQVLPSIAGADVAAVGNLV